MRSMDVLQMQKRLGMTVSYLSERQKMFSIRPLRRSIVLFSPCSLAPSVTSEYSVLPECSDRSIELD